MKKGLNVFLLLSFLAGYLEWGKDNHLFLFQAEAEIFVKALSDLVSVLHPLILIPFFGQILILFSLFQREPGRVVTLIGLGFLSSIMVVLIIIGVIVPNAKVLLSTLPFVVAGALVFRSQRRQPPSSSPNS